MRYTWLTPGLSIISDGSRVPETRVIQNQMFHNMKVSNCKVMTGMRYYTWLALGLYRLVRVRVLAENRVSEVP